MKKLLSELLVVHASGTDSTLSSPDPKKEHSYESARELSLEDSEELELPVPLLLAIAID